MATPEPDIQPMPRLTAIDVVSLTDTEIRATLIHLTGHRDPVVAEAVWVAVKGVLARTRIAPRGQQD